MTRENVIQGSRLLQGRPRAQRRLSPDKTPTPVTARGHSPFQDHLSSSSPRRQPKTASVPDESQSELVLPRPLREVVDIGFLIY